jgi:pimeloyl-ACP methyl ester carboxylesterase
MLPAPLDEAITANGVTLQVRRWGGRGPWLVLLTGLGSAADTFDDFAVGFIDCFRVVGITRRGQPPSACPASGYELATLVADVVAVLDALHVESAHVAGHSLGGLEMTEMAVRHRERLLSLAFLDAGFDPASAARIQADDPIAAPDPGLPQVAAAIDRWWGQHTPDYSRIDVPTLSIYALQSEHPDNAAGPGGTRDADADAFWRSVVSPWVRAQAATFARQVPHAEVVILEHASHYLYKDARARVVEAMRAFYARLGIRCAPST